MINDDLTFRDFNKRELEIITKNYLEDTKKYQLNINHRFDNNEGMIVDAFQLKSQGVPYLNTISIENIENFGIYFHEKSEHVKNTITYNTRLVDLYTNETNFDWLLNIYTNLHLFVNICDDLAKEKINEMLGNLKSIQQQEQTSNFNTNDQIKTPIMVSQGGGKQEQDLLNYIALFIRFIMYHFPLLVHNNQLISIFDHADISMQQTGGSSDYEIAALTDYSRGPKQDERLVYLISAKINEQTTKYFIKITLGVDKYKKEIHNYHYLNDYVDTLESQGKYAPKITRMYSPWKNNEMSSYVLKNDNKISLIFDDTQYDMNIPQNIESNVTNFRETAHKNLHNELFYMITEYDGTYTPSVKTKQINQNTKLRTYIQIAKDLYILNENLGFVHWDLHQANILFKLTKDKELCPKFFDFDLSDLCLIKNEQNMTELNNTYFSLTLNYKMCNIANLKMIMDTNILTNEENIQYRIKTGYLFDLLRVHSTLLNGITEQELDIFNMDMKQFIFGWMSELDELKKGKNMTAYFDTITEFVIGWANDDYSYKNCVSDFLEAYIICFEFESCQITLMCAYNFVFSQQYNHANKQLFFDEISRQVDTEVLTPENGKYMTDELMVLNDILQNKRYNETDLNKFSTLRATIMKKCSVSPSFREYKSFIYNKVKQRIEEKRALQKKYNESKKDYLAMNITK